ncbi:MAG: type I glyceraldehyde-3-phosphate dehydrogenase [Pseudomonadota bacterium]|nr:type I glyceraldehyde-3-phosphate dehydrogenase [Porticoccaceae bacterium]MCH2560049.1 type I glyceraldehyde-3-phosphate dehydrogenase [Pseudomonadales bacterium]MDP7403874.1 type I glyceraldehyde-3-phosphate dehydrogenase [Porticoccaceae bacterium]MEC7620238.1 type I glyceraldehyde-3-phosphate dehydrogenase [Pseudomonadota bacterium]GIR41526.1 MAG: glyceraldehyde-3-phosphate dehydrogenase [Porticoccaceae bacterium]|tara:strand:- start:59 stop:1063 length:1005 start_codon:yes stop_codon:yes gene_type:complete
MLNIAINGFGRIGRNIVRAYYERPELHQKIKIVAINDLGDSSINAHLLQFDSVHGYFHKIVTHDEHSLTVENNKILCFSERDPSKLPWKEHKIDLVCECTGLFTDKQSAAKHITAGAKKVLISAPGKNVDATVVYGINDQSLKSTDKIISNASCTTNCLAPIAKPLNDSLGIETGLMTTIHAYTNDQQLSDSYHSDVYRARSATMSMIPTKTGAASAISEVIPELIGKLDGMAVRVPTINVSLVDFSFNATRETSKEEVNTIIKDAAENSLQGILNYSDKPLVSIDYNHNPHSSNFDSLQTKVKGSLVKVMSWYDNEWGFCNRMLDNINAIFKA